MSEVIKHAGSILVEACHGASKSAGWWNDLHTGEPLPLTQERVGDKLMLIVTEVAEAKEGHRKSKMDDHLPHRPMIEVELADAVIRIAGMAAIPASMPAIEPQAQVSTNRIRRFLGLGGGIAWGGFNYHRGPGWTHAQVKRMARKARNRRRNKIAVAKKGGA